MSYIIFSTKRGYVPIFVLKKKLEPEILECQNLQVPTRTADALDEDVDG